MIGYIIAKELEFVDKKINSNDYYIIKYDVDKKNININLAQQFFDLVSDNERSKSNLMLACYTMYRKMKLIQAEKWFLIKDFGRSGKGLFMETFEKLLNVNKVNFDSLLSSGFEGCK